VFELSIVRKHPQPDREIEERTKPDSRTEDGVAVASKELKAVGAPKLALKIDVAPDFIVVGLEGGDRDLDWLSIVELGFRFAHGEARRGKASQCRPRRQVEVLDLVLSAGPVRPVADESAFDFECSPLNERKAALKKARVVEG
jgi:hypothetical protein